MPRQRYRSFEEWGRRERDRRLRAATETVPESAGGAVGVRLRFRAELAANGPASTVPECRAVVLEWLQQTLGRRLPRKAWRLRPFSVRAEDLAIRATRLRDGNRDHWAVQVARTRGADQELATEVVVGRGESGAATVAVTVRDRSAVPVEAVHGYPAEMLAVMGERVPLLQGGRRLTPRPIVVESNVAMSTFLKMLVDPGRDMPFVVISVPPDSDEREAQEAAWDSLARSLTGLAVTWVLPAAMTYRLSDTVGRRRSVFLGAWRFYRPGFRPGADHSDHPLVLRARLENQRGVADTSRRFVRMAAEERMRADRDEEDGSPDYATVAQESAGITSGPARFVSFLRNSILATSAPQSQPGYSASASQPGSAAPGLVREPSPATGAASSATRARSPATGVAPPGAPGAREPYTPEAPLLRRKLRAARQAARVRASRYERERKRAERAEHERDGLRRRNEQLAGLVRSMGGNPDADVPFPRSWGEFAAWCDENLAGRVALTAFAKRELSGATFRDVGLAAICLGWLARQYRDARLQGGEPRLHGRIGDIEDGVFNLPCGGDAFECSWDRRTHTVDWHIKRGANTRDPRRCLRIYYFWDEQTRQVVVASMPAHRRNALS